MPAPGQEICHHQGVHSWHTADCLRRYQGQLFCVVSDENNDRVKPSDWFPSPNIPTFPFHCTRRNDALTESKDKEKIFSELLSDEGFIPKTYIELLKLNIRRQTTQCLKISRSPEQTPTKKDDKQACERLLPITGH